MKFGETLHQRSVPKWAAYNLNYNELKHLIKLRTTTGAPSPVPIPGQSSHRWSLLEDELYGILKEQYENIALFQRSKHGEFERRLAYLDKSVRSAKRSAKLYSGRPSLLARKYQRLIQDAESIGEDIQSLSRFAAVQKTAFRKILKKYRKWTDSDSLRQRLETEVFSDGQLDLDLSDQMQHLAAQTAVIKGLEEDLLQPAGLAQARRGSHQFNIESPASQITRAAQLGPLHFDAAVASVPYGEAAGVAAYWIHSDNLAEARVLLLRYMRELDPQQSISRQNSNDSLVSGTRTPTTIGQTNIGYFDNGHRYMQDSRNHSPSKAALTARWSSTKEALITLSDVSPRSDHSATVPIKKKELGSTLDRNSALPKEKTANIANLRIVKDFLSEHRDFKALAMSRSARTRYLGINNSSEVGTFAILDSNIAIAPFDSTVINALDVDFVSTQHFPHAVLQIRWEFGQKPEVIRGFDNTHLAEPIPEFSLENATICIQNPDLGNVPWASLLNKDIRKVPVQVRISKRAELTTGSSSDPSSTDGPANSVFSVVADRSTGESENSPVASTHNLHVHETTGKSKPKKKARIVADSPQRSTVRYYSEYDDPDSELYQQEAYAIYVDPNEEAPGIATIRKIGSAFSGALNWVRTSIRGRSKQPTEHTPLLHGENDQLLDEETHSSESDSDETQNTIYKVSTANGRSAPHRRIRLSRRQRAHERTLTFFYSGLLILSYILLLMSAIILTTGRKKETLEVDVVATMGVIVALLCMFLSCGIVSMRRTKFTSAQWVALILADGMIIVLGAATIVGIVQRATYFRN